MYIIWQGLDCQIKVFVEHRLRQRVELYCRTFATCRLDSQYNRGIIHLISGKICAAQKQAPCIKFWNPIFTLALYDRPLYQSLFAEACLKDFLYRVTNKCGVFLNQDCRLWQETEKWHPILQRRSNKRDQGGLTYFFYWQLALNIKRANAVNLVTKKVYAIGVFIGIGIDIKNTATNGKFTRFIYIISMLESHIKQFLLDARKIILSTHLNIETRGFERCLCHNLDRQSLWIGHNNLSAGETCADVGEPA